MVFCFTDGSWNTSDPVTINVGSVAVPVSKMLPVGDKLWCSCHNTVKIFDTVTLQFQVSRHLLFTTPTKNLQQSLLVLYLPITYVLFSVSALIRGRWRFKPFNHQHGRVGDGRVAVPAELGRAPTGPFAHVRSTGRSQHGPGRHQNAFE